MQVGTQPTQLQSLLGSTHKGGTKRARTDFFGMPAIPGQVARFQLESQGGRQQMNANLGALRSDYFQPGSKRMRGLDGSALTPFQNNNPLGALGGGPGQVNPSEELGRFARPSFANVGTIGFHANHTVPGNMTLIYNANSSYELPNKRDWAFFRRQTDEELQRLVSTPSGHVVDETPRTAFTLASLNHYLASKQRKPRTVEEMLGIDPVITDGVNYRDPSSIMREFYLAGVIDAGETANGWSTEPYMFNPLMDNVDQWNKVGITISGRATATPIFGPNLGVNAHCFFVLMPVKRPSTYVVGENSAGKVALQFSEAQKQELHDQPFQFVPMSSSKRAPPANKIIYTDDSGRKVRAKFMFAATVAKQRDPGGELSVEHSMRDVSFIHAQGVQEFVVHH